MRDLRSALFIMNNSDFTPSRFALRQGSSSLWEMWLLTHWSHCMGDVAKYFCLPNKDIYFYKDYRDHILEFILSLKFHGRFWENRTVLLLLFEPDWLYFWGSEEIGPYLRGKSTVFLSDDIAKTFLTREIETFVVAILSERMECVREWDLLLQC